MPPKINTINMSLLDYFFMWCERLSKKVISLLFQFKK